MRRRLGRNTFVRAERRQPPGNFSGNLRPGASANRHERPDTSTKRKRPCGNTAEAVVALIDDPHRFANSKRLGSYFGLVPMQDQSGNNNRLGHITREGSATVRHLLTEAVWQAVRRSPTIKAHLKRIQRDDPNRRKIAIVATAHYLIRVMWSMLKHNTLWRESVMAEAA